MSTQFERGREVAVVRELGRLSTSNLPDVSDDPEVLSIGDIEEALRLVYAEGYNQGHDVAGEATSRSVLSVGDQVTFEHTNGSRLVGTVMVGGVGPVISTPALSWELEEWGRHGWMLVHVAPLFIDNDNDKDEEA